MQIAGVDLGHGLILLVPPGARFGLRHGRVLLVEILGRNAVYVAVGARQRVVTEGAAAVGVARSAAVDRQYDVARADLFVPAGGPAAADRIHAVAQRAAVVMPGALCPVLPSDSDKNVLKARAQRMCRNAYFFCFLVLTLAGLAGCSGGPSAKEPKKAATAPDKIQGKVQEIVSESTATDIALNAGGPSVYLLDGLRRYRLFFRTAFQVDPSKEYICRGRLCAKGH